jgi:hypothetical protein
MTTPVGITFDAEALKRLIEESPLSYKETEGSFIFECPRCCKADKLWIRKKDGRFICFVCAETERFKGRPEYALTELLGQPLDYIKQRLYGEAWHDENSEVYLPGELIDFSEEPYAEYEPPTHAEIAWPWDSYEITDRNSIRGAAYLKSRGVPTDIAASYGIRYWTSQRRVLFPVSHHGKLIGHQARAIFPCEWLDADGKVKTAVKIVTSDGLERDRALMFHDRLIGSPHVVLCEGPMDAIKAHLCGGNVATMGKVVSRGQLDLIRYMGVKKVYLALDPDATEECSRIVREFYDDMEVYLMQPPAGFKDLGDMSFEAVREVFDTAPRVAPNHLFVYLRSPT